MNVISVRRSTTLDVVRGVAILQVLIWHSSLAHKSGRILEIILGLTWSGVDLFFVLSGFLIGGIIIDQRISVNFYSVFYGRRALRILPLYAVLILCLLVFTGSIGAPWYYVTFTQNFLWAAQGSWGPPWTGVTWSLAVEEQFYLLLPVIVRFCPPRHLPKLLMSLICVTPFVRELAVSFYGNRFAAVLLFPCRMDALFLGVLAAWAIRQPAIVLRLQSLRWVQSLSLLALWSGFGFLLLGNYDVLSPFMQNIGYSWIALTYSATLLCIVLRPESDRISDRYLAPFAYAGLGAYSIYLFHLPMRQILPVTGISNLLVQMVLIFGLAALLWRFMERPLIGFGQRRLRYRPLTASRLPRLTPDRPLDVLAGGIALAKNNVVEKAS